MELAAIYAISQMLDPYKIRYAGSAENPMARYLDHMNGRDSGRTKEWFKRTRTMDISHVMYVIEWVPSHLRFEAEAYWIRELRSRGYPLLNDSHKVYSKAKTGLDYLPSCDFSPVTAITYPPFLGRNWERVLEGAKQNPGAVEKWRQGIKERADQAEWLNRRRAGLFGAMR